MASYAYEGADVGGDILAKYGASGGLAQIYATPGKALVHKWHHYLPIYDRYFAAFRGRPLRFLEIGVSGGGSLAMWRDYFGPEAVIFGIDIDPDCAAYDGQSAQVRIGSQDDPAFLAAVVAEMGGVDVVLDDGSHQMDHIRASFAALFGHLSDGGLYMIEDLHAAFGPAFGGGITADGNFFNDLRRVTDDMHHWYHRAPVHDFARAAMVTGVHIHDSIVVIDKGKVYPPTHSKVGPA
jgi:hypothetical protein